MRSSLFNVRPPQPPPPAGFVKITLIGIVGLLGTLLIFALTPTLQYHRVAHTLLRTELLLDQKNPGEAIQQLFALPPLLEFFPELTPLFRGHLIRAYTQAGHLDEAFAISQKPAGWTDVWRLSSSSPRPTVSPLVRFAQRFPALKSKPPVNPYAGKSDLTIFRDQLVDLNRWDLFLPYDPSIPPTPPAPTPPTPKPSPQPSPPSSPPPPPSPPPPTPAETRARLEERLAQLTDQVTSLSNQIVVARAELGKAVQPPLTPAQAAAKARHQKAVQTFNRFVDENIRIKNEMDKASGARRAELLDQLKARRYQEQSLQRELRDAQAAFEQLQPPPHPKADIEKRIRTLTEEYRRTIRQIEAAQNDLEQTDNPVETHET